jgi:threonine synthase
MGLEIVEQLGWEVPDVILYPTGGGVGLIGIYKVLKELQALGDFLILEALYETDGCAVAIDDQTLLAQQEEIAKLEGAFVCPEGAATFSAAKQLRENGWIKDGEAVVALNTGAGIKYPDTVSVGVPILETNEMIKELLVSSLLYAKKIG